MNPLVLRPATQADKDRAEEVMRRTRGWNSGSVALALAIVLNDNANLERIIAGQRAALAGAPGSKTGTKYFVPAGSEADNLLERIRTKHRFNPSDEETRAE